MTRFPFINALSANTAGWGFFLCAHKDVRTSRTGETFVSLTLQDRTGLIPAKIFTEVDRYRDEFDEGEFVKAQGRIDLYNGRLQLIVERVRRVNPDQDQAAGFREDDCVPSADRPIEEMWAELQGLVSGMTNRFLQALVERLVAAHEARLRVWPAAQLVHHAYRGGFLEHILSVAHVALGLARHYEADADLVLTGAVLHDIGKLQELDYDRSIRYSREGNLVGHLALGLLMVREVTLAIPDFPSVLRTQVEHLVVSHHGSREFGSPVVPMTIEAMIVSASDDLDAKINQVRQAIDAAGGDEEFTPYHPRLGRVLWKPGDRG
jgi:3'-5' exoribonuclease